MTINLIVNADDYGRTPAISSGIRFAHLHGIVTSTTAMMNMPQVNADLLKAMEDCPHLGLGVHLVLTSGSPVLPAAHLHSLLDEDGRFPSAARFLDFLPTLDPDQVRSEWSAQVERFVKITGRNPDHLDSHHHTSYFSPVLFRIMLEISKQLGCGIRPPLSGQGGGLPLDLPPELASQPMDFIPSLLAEFAPPSPDNFYSSFYDQDATLDSLLNLLADLPDGVSELMCHPGFIDPEIMTVSSYNSQRESERQILTDPILLAFLQDNLIHLKNYSHLL